jgi:hypothetical protein
MIKRQSNPNRDRQGAEKYSEPRPSGSGKVLRTATVRERKSTPNRDRQGAEKYSASQPSGTQLFRSLTVAVRSFCVCVGALGILGWGLQLPFDIAKIGILLPIEALYVHASDYF